MTVPARLGGVRWIAVAVGVALCPAPSGAADGPSRAWAYTADLGLVVTSGNTEITNLSMNNLLQWTRGATTTELKAQVLRVDTTSDDVVLDLSDPAQPRLVVHERRARTTEQYDAALRVNRQVHARLGWFTFGRYEQNEPSGLDGRLSAGGGLAFLFPERQDRTARIEAGLDAVREKGVADREYLGLRLAGRYERDITAVSRFLSSLELLENLQDAGDLRVNADAGLAVSLNSRFALKTSYSLKYDREPRVRTFAVPDGSPLVYEYGTTDTVLSTSLVMKF